MTRTDRHDGVRTFGRRSPTGSRANVLVADHARANAFGVRVNFVVRTPEQIAALAQEEVSSVANLAAAVSVAAVLISVAPSGAHAEVATPATGEPAVSEVVQLDSSGMDVPVAAAIADDSATTDRELYLEVYINDVSTGLAGNFRETPDGGLACEFNELTEVGLKPVESATGHDGWVRVDQLPGVEYRIDEEAQRIYVTTGLEGRSTRKINLGAQPDQDRLTPTAAWGGVLNYSLFATTNSLTIDEEKDLFQGVAGSFDARIFSPFGTVRQGFQVGYSDGEVDDFVRLNTTWTYSDADRMMTYRAGDFTSSGLSWTRPVYLGGIQAQRSFKLRSDLVTMPLASFKGTAAVPSTLEVYTQNTKTYSEPIGEGPFEVSNLPIYSGGGEARVVLKDSLGRETETNLPFYASSNMLAEGFLDFSVEAGMPRRNYGVESFDYDERVYGVATARYGLTDWLTLEGHAEGGEDLQNGGIGAIFPLGGYGIGSVAMAGSNHEGATGALVNASVELAYNEWSFYGRVQRTFGDYNDIASVTAEYQPVMTGLGSIDKQSSKAPKAIEQVAVSVPLPLDLTALNLSYTHIEEADGDESQIVGVSYSQQVFKKVSLYAMAFADLEEKDSFGVYAGISMPLGGDYFASTGVDSSSDGTRINASVSKSEKLENGNFSWRAQTSEGKNSVRSASAAYRSPWARFEAGVQQVDKDFRATGQVDGAIAVAGGGIFAANRIDDAFAVVDVGASDVDVLFQNRPFGKTNKSGKLLVTGLNSYEKNMLEIDPKSLPVDASIPATKEVVMPAGQSGVKVDFGVNTDTRSALVNLVDASGTPLEVGLEVKVNGSDQAYFVGYDGQAYVEGLKASNALLVNLSDGRECHASFSYKPKKGEQTVIDAVPCI